MKLIFKTVSFTKWQKKATIKNEVLVKAIEEMACGLIDADLGGGLFKKRVPRPGFGKRSGYRTLIATNLEDKWFFILGFAKNEQDNIDAAELVALQKYAKFLLNISKEDIKHSLQSNELVELKNEKK
ncbi:MAG TPA: type II toxin-antitoxin system RelE/ParE family toxin [Aquella sp.]|nr:type II toxin-antitoxin system RelE/ParE family toxin [Aquella sp.]